MTLLRRYQPNAIKTAGYIVGRESDRYLAEEIATVEKRLREDGVVLSNSKAINKRWATQLYDRFDGKALEHFAKVKQQHSWVYGITRFLSGRDFVNSIRLRINAMPTRARCSRGRVKEKMCRAGCGAVETLNHVFQQCHRTHGARIKRHDAITSYVGKRLAHNGYVVHKEPRIRVNENVVLVPDIIAVKDEVGLVLDAQVVSDQIHPDLAHRTKRAKYGGMDFLTTVLRNYRVTTAKSMTITLNWRGVWSPASVKQLVDTAVIKRSDIKIISSRALIGGIAAHSIFNQSTSVVDRRVGGG